MINYYKTRMSNNTFLIVGTNVKYEVNKVKNDVYDGENTNFVVKTSLKTLPEKFIADSDIHIINVHENGLIYVYIVFYSDEPNVEIEPIYLYLFIPQEILQNIKSNGSQQTTPHGNPILHILQSDFEFNYVEKKEEEGITLINSELHVIDPFDGSHNVYSSDGSLILSSVKKEKYIITL